MAIQDRQFVVTGTGSLVLQDFGFWADSQVIRVTGAAANISFDGTNAISIAPGTGLEYGNHMRSGVWVSGVGATINIIASNGSEV